MITYGGIPGENVVLAVACRIIGNWIAYVLHVLVMWTKAAEDPSEKTTTPDINKRLKAK
jgi:hypothetical protein